jgi:hypothetical protein
MGFRTYSAYLPGENAPVEVYRKDEVDSYLSGTPELEPETVVPQGSAVSLQVYGKGEADRYIGKLRAENDSLAHLYGEAQASAGRYRRAMWRGIRNWARVMWAIHKYLRQARNGWNKVWDRCDKELGG